MVTGNEYNFDSIDEALKYVLETEQRTLEADPYRQTPPSVVRPLPGMFSQPCTDEMVEQALMPIDSQDCPHSAWFNNAVDDKFVMTLPHED